MAKANYRAWHITANDFSSEWSNIEKLLFFARYAILAPSGHNTQPWHFSRNAQTLDLKVNPDRNLPFSGKLAAEPHISLGNCIETLILAARGFGYEVGVQYDFNKDVITGFSIKSKIEADPLLLDAIVQRTSNRSLYKEEGLSDTQLEEIIKSKFKNISTYLVNNAEDISFLADQTRHATQIIMSEPEFRSELSEWVRSNVSKKHDGMPGFAQGMPTPPSLIAKHIIKHIDISKSQAKTDAERVRHSAAIALIQIDKPDEEAFLNAGRQYARICILAQKKGLATSGIGAAVIDVKTKQAITERFKLTREPVALIRIGHATKPARHTPRWPLEKVIAPAKQNTTFRGDGSASHKLSFPSEAYP